jgi:DNA-binding NtrC family response regulator
VAETERGLPTHVCGSGSLLLVEDDEQVRSALSRLLADRGFQVIPVGGKAEALAFLDRFHPKLELMITDVVMSGGDGVSLANEARARLPDLRVLFMSGHTEHAILDELAQPGTHFMAKPFVGADLDAALRALIGAGVEKRCD